jgi:hypothetical protein
LRAPSASATASVSSDVCRAICPSATATACCTRMPDSGSCRIDPGSAPDTTRSPASRDPCPAILARANDAECTETDQRL